MAIEVVLPRLGWGGEGGSLVEWIKHDGDPVKAGDVICTVEGDKAVNEVESLDSGTLHIPPDAPSPGTKVPVGTVLAYLIQPGEAVPRLGQAPPVASLPDTPTISPRAHRVANELGVDWTILQGSGRTGRIVERDVRGAAAQRSEAEAVRISPVARQVAEDLGVDRESLARVKPGQRLTRADVEEAARSSEIPTKPMRTGTPLSGVRRIIAERLAASAHTVAPVTLTTEADATALVQLRTQIKTDLAETELPIPSYNDLLAKLVAVALQDYPALNASLVDDGIVEHPTVNLGIAVDTDRGLLVPVVRDVQIKSVQRVAEESARLIGQARTGKISSDDLRGGTFTITNLGMYEIDAFTPIINLPECAILGVGRIVSRPVVVDEETEEIAVRKMLALSLTFDHRLIDGAPAAHFLQRVKHLVEHPGIWLIR